MMKILNISYRYYKYTQGFKRNMNIIIREMEAMK